MSRATGASRRLVADRRRPKASKPRAGTASKAKTRRKSGPRKGRIRGAIARFFGGILRWALRLVWRLAAFATVVIALIVGTAVAYTASTLPPLSDLVDGRARGSVTLLNRDGDVFALRGDQFGGAVTAQTVSPHLRNAVVATEDKRFYSHFGISPRGIASAVRINLSEGRSALSGHGGSTITQQTAKLLCLGVRYDPATWDSEAAYVADCRRSTLHRKAREAIFALAMEVTYSKDEILSIYLNRAYMGAGAHGAEAAAQRYFGKSAAALNPSEAAMIAGLLTAPSRLAPTSNLDRSHARAATVLRLMQEQGYLTEQEARTWQASPAGLAEDSRDLGGGYFADWVMQAGPDFFTRDTTEDVIIQTTLDPRIQTAVEAGVDKVFAEKVRPGSKAQVAVVVMSADGAVRGMVGGRDVKATGVFNRATQAVRQTGSSFKPFVYATALELGWSPLDPVVDDPFCMQIPGSGQWCPENYSGRYLGEVTLTEALAKSLNIPAVKVSEAVGRDLVHRVAHDFGIRSKLTDTPALALGASEATLLEMTGAFAGILNGGSAVTPFGLQALSLAGDDTPLIGQDGGIGERVIAPRAARQLVWMMSKVINEGTGARAALPDRPVAGKTGTSQEARDAWFIGFTADYVAGVWMGYDDNTSLTGVTGGGLPSEIWHEVMVRVHAGVPARPLPVEAPEPRIVQQAPAPAPAPVLPTQQSESESLLRQVLRDILGGN